MTEVEATAGAPAAAAAPATKETAEIHRQQPQQQQQQQVQPVVGSNVQQHDQQRIVAAIDDFEEGEGNSSGKGVGTDSTSTCNEGEEKHEVDWAPPTTKTLSPIAERTPASVILRADASTGSVHNDQLRDSSMPILSAGPHFPHKPRRLQGGSLNSLFSLNKQKQQEQHGPRRRRWRHNVHLSTRKGGREAGMTSPNSRPRIRKMTSTLGMLQNAQDQAASPVFPGKPHYPGGSSVFAGKGGAESSTAAANVGRGDVAAGNILAGHKGSSRRMGLVGFGGGREPSLGHPTPAPAEVAVNKRRERPPLTWKSINQTPTVGDEEVPPLVDTSRRLIRQNSVSFIRRLPRPRLLMQVLEENIDPKNVRLTTQSKPVILMEVMPAALVVSLLALTYLVFASCVALIVLFHLRGTSTFAMGPGSGDGARELCTRGSSFTATVSTSGGEGDVFIIGADGPDLHSPSAAGCTMFSPGLSELSLDLPLPSSSTSTSSSLTDADPDRYGAIFSGQFSGMTDLSGIVSLHVSFADTEVQESLPDPAVVDIALEACVEEVTAVSGASTSQADLEWGTCQEGWQPVLFQENISARVRSLPENQGYTLFNFYQNQDTIRGQALVRQYRVQIGFVSTTTSSSSSDGSNGSSEEPFSWVSEARWSLEYETGATTEWAKVVLAVVLMCWVPVWLAWCWTVFYKNVEGEEGGFKDAMHERKWLGLVGLSVVLYLNPIKVVGNFVAPRSASWGLASEMSLSVAVAMFLVLALCMADGVRRDRVGRGPLGFYLPKVVFGVLTLACMLLVDLVSFPTLMGTPRGSLLAVQNWPESQQHTFEWVASARIFMVMLWVVWMLCRIYTSGSLLKKLPYVPNRYQQLSYRFFTLQVFLLGIVYATFALWRLIVILNDDLGRNTFAARLMLLVKTRPDHLGSVSTVCAYALQLFLLFLPSSFKESKLFRHIAVGFVYFEEQLPIAMRKSGEGMEAGGVSDSASRGQAREKSSVFQGGNLNPGEHPNTSPGDVGKEDEQEKPLFCVETAAWLLELAWEAYADPVGFKNPHNYHTRVQRLARMGFELVRHIHNVEHDTNCFILKDVPRGRLVVTFRGSVGTKHWMDNLRLFQTEFNMDHMMPTGREHEATKVLEEDIDIQAAKSLHDVVAHRASTREAEEEGCSDVFEERKEPAGGTQVAPSPAVVAGTAGAPPSSQLPSSHVAEPPPVAMAPSSSCSPVDGHERPTTNNCGRGEPGNGLSIEVPAGAQSCPGDLRRVRTGRVQGGGGGSDAGGGISQQQQLHPISPPGILAVLKGFSVPRWQFREQLRDVHRWDFADHANGATSTDGAGSEPSPAGVYSSRGGTVSGATVGHDQTGGAATAAAEGRDGAGVGLAPSEGGGVANAPPPSAPRSPSAPPPRGFPRSGSISNVGSPDPPRLLGSHSMSLVSDIEEGKGTWLRRGSAIGKATTVEEGRARRGGSINGGGRRSTPTKSFKGGIELIGSEGSGEEARAGGSSTRPHRRRSASFDLAAILKSRDGEEAALSRNGEGGAPWRMGVGVTWLPSGGRSWRGVPGVSPGAMQGLGPEFDRRKEDSGRVRKSAFDMLREAARRGIEAVDKAAHATGINRIPFLRQCLWGQVHTGFWNSYESVRGELHTCVRETVIDWILSQDNPPDIKIYVTGHSMGGALATHCAMDLKLYTIDKIQARLGNFMRARRTIMQKASGLPPRRTQQQPRDTTNVAGKAHENGPGGGRRGGPKDDTGPQKDGSRALRRPPPSSSSTILPGKGDLEAAAAGGAVATGGEAKSHNSLRGLASTLSTRFQAMRGTSAEETGGIAHCENDESRSDGRHSDGSDSACSISSGNGNDGEPRASTDVLSRMASRLTTVASSFGRRNHVLSPTLRRPFWGSEVDGGGSGKAEQVPSDPQVELRMYSFGAPRVGNSIYAARYNDVVPDSFRVVVDGDPVPGVPSWRYTHAGTKVLIDGRGRGSLIIDPSFVEKRFFARSKTYVLSHLIQVYQAGLRGNLLQAVDPELQGSVPAHWPYGIKDDSSSDSSSDDDHDDKGGTGTKERREEEKDVGEEADTDTDSEGEGEGEGDLPSSSISVRQDIMAQQAVNALKRADRLNRGQSFRLVARSVSRASLRPTTPAPAVVSGAGRDDRSTGRDGGRRATTMTARQDNGDGGGGGISGLAEGAKQLLRPGDSSRDLATMEEGSDGGGCGIARCGSRDGEASNSGKGGGGDADDTER